MRTKKIIISVLLAALGVLASRGALQGSSFPKISGDVAGQATSQSPCRSVNGLPDSKCTPGAVDHRVTQENIRQTICVSGYTQTVRPPVTYTETLKVKIMQEYGDTDSPKNYELDHLISLELGGDPESEQNLWPEPYNIPYGAHQKDDVENYLHKQVCSGAMTLQQAQREISTNWINVYKKITGSN